MKTLTMARIHESQGYMDEAIEIYKLLLEEDPQHEEALSSLARLTHLRKTFAGVNQKKKFFFMRMHKKEQFTKFEKWLGASWN